MIDDNPQFGQTPGQLTYLWQKIRPHQHIELQIARDQVFHIGEETPRLHIGEIPPATANPTKEFVGRQTIYIPRKLLPIRIDMPYQSDDPGSLGC